MSADQTIKDIIYSLPEHDGKIGNKFLRLVLEQRGEAEFTQMLNRIDAILDQREDLSMRDFAAEELDILKIAGAENVGRREFMSRLGQILAGAALVADGAYQGKREFKKIEDSHQTRAVKAVGRVAEIGTGIWVIDRLAREQDAQRLEQIANAITSFVFKVESMSVKGGRGH